MSVSSLPTTAFEDFVQQFSRHLRDVATRPGDAEQRCDISGMLTEYGRIFQDGWPNGAMRLGDVELDQEFWRRQEAASKFLLTLQNRRDIGLDAKSILKDMSKPFLRPLEQRVLGDVNARGLYNYRPLTYDPVHGVAQIRILHLLSRPGEALRCRIEHSNLASAEFIALSYEWGETDRLHLIEVVELDGSSAGMIPLTNNLHSALCNLRDSPDLATMNVFWVDQVCINQADKTERGHQVGMMGKLYTAARRVVSYVGPEDIFDQEAFELLDKIHQQYHHMYRDALIDSDWLKNSQRFSSPDWSPESLRFRGEVTPSAMQGLMEIILGPWTRRLWMLQETCLNAATDDVLMLRGNRTVEWTTLAAAFRINCIRLLPMPIEITFSDMEFQVLHLCWIVRGGLNDEASWPFTRPDLFVLLTLCSGTVTCSDPRDRVFAVLGLARDGEELGITADYNGTYDDVLLDVTTRMIERKGNLKPLDFLSSENPDNEQRLPSWVCRWPGVTGVIDGCNAKGDWSGDVHFSADRHHMFLPGIHVTRIVQAMPAFRFRLMGILNSSHLSQIESTVAAARVHQARPFPYNFATDKVLAETLCASQLVGDSGSTWTRAIDDLLDLITMAKQQLQRGRSNEGAGMKLLSLTKNLAEDQKEAVERIIYRSNLYVRAICMTEDAGICLAPQNAKPGDIVTILRGGENLYVLRPAGGEYRYVGDAYMHGYMNGEATMEPDWEQKIEEITLI